MRGHRLRVKSWAHQCVQGETQGSLPERRHPEKRQRRTKASEVSGKEGSRQQKKGGVCIPQEMGETLGKTRRMINCVTHGSQVEQVEDCGGQRSGEAEGFHRGLGAEALLGILQGEWQIKWDEGRQTTLRKTLLEALGKRVAGESQGQFSKAEDRP